MRLWVFLLVAVIAVVGLWLWRPQLATPMHENPTPDSRSTDGAVSPPSAGPHADAQRMEDAAGAASKAATTTSPPRAPQSIPAPPVVPPAGAAVPEAAAEPPEFAGFATASEEERYALLAPWYGAQIGLPMQTFLLRQLAVRSHDETMRNNLANMLDAQRPLPVGYLDQLSAMADDPTESVVWRDYAVQHIAACAEDPDVRSEVVDRLWNWACRGHGRQRGTALLVLSRVADRFPLAPLPEAYPQQVLSTMIDSQLDLETRVTAVRIARERRIMDAVPLWRDMLVGEHQTAMRIAVVQALGSLGSAADREALHRIAGDPADPATADAQRALQTLPAP